MPCHKKKLVSLSKEKEETKEREAHLEYTKLIAWASPKKQRVNWVYKRLENSLVNRVTQNL